MNLDVPALFQVRKMFLLRGRAGRDRSGSLRRGDGHYLSAARLGGLSRGKRSHEDRGRHQPLPGRRDLRLWPLRRSTSSTTKAGQLHQRRGVAGGRWLDRDMTKDTVRAREQTAQAVAQAAPIAGVTSRTRDRRRPWTLPGQARRAGALPSARLGPPTAQRRGPAGHE